MRRGIPCAPGPHPGRSGCRARTTGASPHPVRSEPVRIPEPVGVPVGATPQEEEVGARGESGPAEFGVRGDVAVMPPEGRIRSQCLLDERRAAPRVRPECVEVLGVLPQEPLQRAQVAHGGFDTRRHELDQDLHRGVVGDLATLQLTGECPEHRCALSGLRPGHRGREVVDQLPGRPERVVELVGRDHPVQHPGTGERPFPQSVGILWRQPHELRDDGGRETLGDVPHPVDPAVSPAVRPQFSQSPTPEARIPGRRGRPARPGRSARRPYRW